MSHDLPPGIAAVFAPLFAVLPLDEALQKLIVPMHGSASAMQCEAVETVIAALPEFPMLHAAAWLYVDELDRAHRICQDQGSGAGAFLHAIVHRREGDFWNSKYWWRRAGTLPSLLLDVDPFKFVDVVEVSDGDSDPDPDLIEVQRREWLAIVAYCAEGSPLEA